MTNIYVVITLMVKRDRIFRSRVWGWFPNQAQAAGAIQENRGDMFEAAYYSHACIEALPLGVMPEVKHRTWFSASYKGSENPVVEEIPEPEWIKGNPISLVMG